MKATLQKSSDIALPLHILFPSRAGGLEQRQLGRTLKCLLKGYTATFRTRLLSSHCTSASIANALQRTHMKPESEGETPRPLFALPKHPTYPCVCIPTPNHSALLRSVIQSVGSSMSTSTDIFCSSFSSSASRSSKTPDTFTVQKHGCELLESKDTKGLRLNVDLTSSHSKRGSTWGFGTLTNLKHKGREGASGLDVFVRWANTASQRKELKREVGVYTKMMKRPGLSGDVVPKFYGLYARQTQKQGLFAGSGGLWIAIFEKIKGTKSVHVQSSEEAKFRCVFILPLPSLLPLVFFSLSISSYC